MVRPMSISLSTVDRGVAMEQQAFPLVVKCLGYLLELRLQHFAGLSADRGDESQSPNKCIALVSADTVCAYERGFRN